MITLPWLMPLVQKSWRFVVGAIAIFPLAFLLGQCSGANNAKAKYERDQAAATVAMQRRDAAAKEAGNLRRAADAETTSSQAKDRSDAISRATDSAPSGAELALACQRLRQQGTPADRLPVACRSGGPTQAPTKR